MNDLENELRELMDEHTRSITGVLSGPAIRQAADARTSRRHKVYAPLAAVAAVVAIATATVLLHGSSTPAVSPAGPGSTTAPAGESTSQPTHSTTRVVTPHSSPSAPRLSSAPNRPPASSVTGPAIQTSPSATGSSSLPRSSHRVARSVSATSTGSAGASSSPG